MTFDQKSLETGARLGLLSCICTLRPSALEDSPKGSVEGIYPGKPEELAQTVAKGVTLIEVHIYRRLSWGRR